MKNSDSEDRFEALYEKITAPESRATAVLLFCCSAVLLFCCSVCLQKNWPSTTNQRSKISIEQLNRELKAERDEINRQVQEGTFDLRKQLAEHPMRPLTRAEALPVDHPIFILGKRT